jgi:hypothetical protein
MPADALDRLQEEKLQGLEALIASYDTATATRGTEDEAAAMRGLIIWRGISQRIGAAA